MNPKTIAISTLAAILGLPAFALPPVSNALPGAPLPPVTAPGQQYGWDAPPQELNELQRRGFHDGIEGAKRDFENHRPPNVENRDEYRHPDLPGEQRKAYREGFRRGYQMALNHLMAPQPQMAPPPPPPPPPMQGGWEERQFSEVEGHGYQDGMIGARKDMDNHRRPDPNNRDEYRNPSVPPQLVEEYRAGFRRGYEQQMAQFMGEVETGPWDQAPGRFSDVGRQGFHDGIEGARRDVENHRRPDPNNRDEYRNPHVPPQFVDDYREGFRRGYERAMAHLLGR